MRLFDTLIGALAPHACVHCQADGSLLCKPCQQALNFLPSYCSLCRQEVSLGAMCDYCCKRNNTSAVFAAVSYASGKRLIHALKFQRAEAAADVIADIMVRRIPMADYTLVHVPTAAIRARMRGYDQAQLIARACARKIHAPVITLLARSGQQRQVGKTKVERGQQLGSAFWARPLNLPPTTPLLLVDDVLTTGATIAAAALALRSAGYTNVQAAVFAAA